MKILLATDGSKFSEAATRFLASELVPKDTEVLVLQVVEPFIYSTPPQMAPGYAPEMAQRREEQFKQARESLAKASETLKPAGFIVNTRVIEAEPRTTILDVAQEFLADLIVMGSHGRKGIEKFLLGSVAESVSRHARCSVLIVRITA